MEWNDEQVLVLIDLYRERRLLWDSSDSQHKLKNQRHDSLTEIAVSFGVDKNEIERKWKNLTSHFWREKKKEAETKRTGSGADEPYVSKWFAYQPMNFLGDKNKPRNTQDSTQRKEEEDGPQDSQEEGINDDSQVVHPQNSEDKQASTLSPSEVAGTKKPFKSPKAPKSKSARRRLVDSPGSSNALDEALNVMRSLQSKRANIDDEYSLYGEQIAIKLRKLPSPRTRLVVQNKINQLLFEAEMGYLEHQHGYNVPQVNTRQNSGPANPMVPSFPQTPTQTQPPFFTDNMTNSTSQWFSTSGYSSLPSSISSYSQSASPASTNSELSNMDPFPQ
ncbi:hypothetical protein J6590_061312 [Homalodisca vitripennis]|nr:hypothetical protein J6590_088620 [Homalodisca vitripennis]KAG8330538.1 hypothetical protein J6590_061312 [Homalodisca vitripennis]